MEKRDDDEELYREEAAHAHDVTPEYQGERLIFDEMRNEPNPDPVEERRAMGPLAAPVEEPPTKSELLGEGVGGDSGALVGAAGGTIVAGPIGTIIGVIASALSGWWATQGISAASETLTPEVERVYAGTSSRPPTVRPTAHTRASATPTCSAGSPAGIRHTWASRSRRLSRSWNGRGPKICGRSTEAGPSSAATPAPHTKGRRSRAASSAPS